MKAQDLRIGNLANVSLKSGNGRTLVREIGYADLERISNNTGSYIYEPIPLTEEWLIKCRFTQLGDDKTTYYLESSNLDFDLVIGHKYDCYLVFFKGANTEVKIKYVHELQNFYSSIGEELTIKQ